MAQSFFSLLSALRPQFDGLSEGVQFQVQIHRLASLAGACLVLAFGPLYALSNPGATDPLWARLGLAALFLTLFGASYVSRHILETYIPYMRVLLYILTGWFAALSALNGFSADYAVGMLMVYAVLTAVIGFGARSIRTVLWFLGYGFLAVTGGAAIGPPPEANLSILLASMGTIAVVEGVLTIGWLRIQRTIREQESQLRGLANTLPGVVFQFYARDDGSVGHYFVSDHAKEVLGIEATPDTFHHQCLQHIPEDALPKIRSSIKQSIENKTDWEFETPFERPDGERIWVHATSTPERKKSEVVFNGVILDVTDQKRAEQALKTERDRLKTLFEVLPTPVVRCVATSDGVRISDANAAFEETFGVDTEEAEGMKINDSLVPDGSEDQAHEINRRVLDGESVQTEVRRMTSDGVQHFQLQAARRHRQDGPPEIHAVYVDITDRKKQERRLGAVFNQTYQFTGLMKPDGTMVEANDTALQFGDLEREEVVGKKLWETHWAQTGQESKEKLKEAVQHAASGEFVRYERPVQGSDQTRIADFSIRPVTSAEGEVTLLIPEARDITPLKQREERLRAAKKEAEEARVEAETASRAKSVMLANMSHEIRTPLTSIIGFAETIGEEIEGGTSVSRFAELIEKSGKRLLNTLDGVLNLAKLEAGEADFEASPIDLCGRARDVVDEFQSQAEKNQVCLRVEANGTPVQALADEKGLSIILHNLVSNAVKYTVKGEVVVRAMRRKGRAILQVEDEGSGMEPSEVEALFEPFRQESEGVDRTHEGTGLGLSVAKRAAEQMNGSLQVETEKEVGSCFTLDLPLPEEKRKPQNERV